MKKQILFLLLAIAALTATAQRNWYLSNIGNDANDGTVNSPWKTTTKANAMFSTFNPGDSLLLKNGDTYFGNIRVTKSGTYSKPITISNYGSVNSPLPILTGYVVLSNWTLVREGVYQAPFNGKGNLNLVSINGVPQAIGRTPNINETWGGYLPYNSSNGTTSITDRNLPNLPDWTGSQAVIRRSGFLADRVVITDQTDGVISYRPYYAANTLTPLVSSSPDSLDGYFIENDPRTLDQIGEWFLDSTNHYLQIYFGSNAPSNYVVKAPLIDTLINAGPLTFNGNGYSYINISNLKLVGAGTDAIFAKNSDYINVSDCEIADCGIKGVHLWNVGNYTIERNKITYAMSNAIQARNTTKDSGVVRFNTLNYTAPFPGMGNFYDFSDNKGMSVSVRNNLLIEGNTVLNTGYSGIDFQGSHIVDQYNTVRNFLLSYNDGGGHYTYVGGNKFTPLGEYTDRVVQYNISDSGIGNFNGTTATSGQANGFYGDGRTMDVIYRGNAATNCSKKGFTFNNPNGIQLLNNFSFNNKFGWGITKWQNDTIQNNVIKGNTFFGKDETQFGGYVSIIGYDNKTLQQWVQQLGVVDSNTYSSQNALLMKIEPYNPGPIRLSDQSLDYWREYTGGFDLHSKQWNRITGYTLQNVVGSNTAIGSGTFATNINGYTTTATNTAGAWDGTSKITGLGSYKLTFSAPVENSYSLMHSQIGSVAVGKKYLLQFDTKGTTKKGSLKVYLRKTGSPYSQIAATQTRSFGTDRITHSFLFEPTQSELIASAAITTDQTSGTTYFDNVNFYEANAVTYTPEYKIATNPTSEYILYKLTGVYTDMNGIAFDCAVLLKPGESKLLVKQN